MAGKSSLEGPGAVRRWIALFDQANHLVAAAARAPHPVAQRRKQRATVSLVRYEHLLPATTRRTAREALWRRDRPGEPLPASAVRAAWEHCRCLPCRRRRGAGAASPAPAAPPHAHNTVDTLDTV
jgi:hypothetical protein